MRKENATNAQENYTHFKEYVFIFELTSRQTALRAMNWALWKEKLNAVQEAYVKKE